MSDRHRARHSRPANNALPNTNTRPVSAHSITSQPVTRWLTLITAAASSLLPTFHRLSPPSFLAAKPISASRSSSASVRPTLMRPSMMAIVAGVTPWLRRIASHSLGRLDEWGGGKPAHARLRGSAQHAEPPKGGMTTYHE